MDDSKQAGMDQFGYRGSPRPALAGAVNHIE
jgi:hypothetical protein